jgi:hypothetical protein
MAQSGKAPTTFMDGIQAAMQDLAGAMSAPDADLHFGTEVIKLMATYVQAQHQNKGQQGQAPSGPPGASSPPPSGAGGGGTPPVSVPGGPAGGGAGNQQMPSMQPPSGPQEPGSGPTPGLTPNPDEMRRVLQETAGQ